MNSNYLKQLNYLVQLVELYPDQNKWEYLPSKLLQQIEDGECYLFEENCSIIRKVDVVVIQVKYQNKLLREYKRVYQNSNKKDRFYYNSKCHISGKIHNDSTPIDEAQKELKEELGLTIPKSRIMPSNFEMPLIKNISKFPFESKYNFVKFEVILESYEYKHEYIEHKSDNSFIVFNWTDV
jgi:hypothetical protein